MFECTFGGLLFFLFCVQRLHKRTPAGIQVRRVPARKPCAHTRAPPALLQWAGGGTVCGASDQAAHRRQRAGAPAHLGGRPPRGCAVPDPWVVRGGPGSLPGALGAAWRDPTGVGVCLPHPSLRLWHLHAHAGLPDAVCLGQGASFKTK